MAYYTEEDVRRAARGEKIDGEPMVTDPDGSSQPLAEWVEQAPDFRTSESPFKAPMDEFFADNPTPTHAGVAVQAEDTRRILLLQRAWDETDAEDVRGTWEFPGGGLEEGEGVEEGAWREFCEETGCPKPEGTLAATWRSPDGVYQGFLWRVPVETEAFEEINPDVDAADTINPDDPQRLNPDVSAWFTVEQMRGLGPALRPEVAKMDWSIFDLEAPMDTDTEIAPDVAARTQLNLRLAGFRKHLAEDVAPVGTARTWFGVMAPEGVPSGDKRMFSPGSLRMRSLPLPLTWQKIAGAGHDGNITVAIIQEVWRAAGLIWGAGEWLDTPEADECYALVDKFGRYGVSIDADDLDEFSIEMDENGVTVFTDARQCSACIVSIPAFAEAFVMNGNYADFAADFAGGWGAPSQQIPTRENEGQDECEERDEDGNCIEREPDAERKAMGHSEGTFAGTEIGVTIEDDESDGEPCDPDNDPDCVADEDHLPEKEQPFAQYADQYERITVPLSITGPKDQISEFFGMTQIIEYLGDVGASRTMSLDLDGDGALMLRFDYGDFEVPEMPDISEALDNGAEIPYGLAYSAVTFKDYTADEREDAHTVPGTDSYPIEDCEDLKNAIQSIGRAKDPAKAKAHIRTQKKRLGCPDVGIPDTWALADDQVACDCETCQHYESINTAAEECDECVKDIAFEEWNGVPVEGLLAAGQKVGQRYLDAKADSRLLNDGVLFLPDKLVSFAREDDDFEVEFSSALMAAMTEPIENVASSVVPLIVQMKDLAPGLTEDGPGWLTHPVDTDRLRDYWVRGPGAAKIGWGTPDDFYRCEAQVAKYVKPQYLKGYCANRHFDALGYWPGQAPHKGEAIAMTSYTATGGQGGAGTAIVAAGGTVSNVVNGVVVGQEPSPASLTASAPMKNPPREWFDDPHLPGPTPLTVTREGRVVGHLAQWGQCHIGIDGQCVMLPKSASDYSYFHLGVIDTADGEVFTGPLVLGGKHAPDRIDWRAATRHYDTTSSVFADIRVGHDDYGVWMSGAIREGVTEEQIREAKASGKVSGDWREVVRGSRQLELICGLVIGGAGGFPVPRTRIGVEQGRVVSLVAAGIVDKDPVDELVDEVAARLEQRAETKVAAESLRSKVVAPRLASLRDRLREE